MSYQAEIIMKCLFIVHWSLYWALVTLLCIGHFIEHWSLYWALITLMNIG